MKVLSPAVQNLIEYFQKLPGIGPKTAARLSYYLLRMPKEEVSGFAQAIIDLKEKTVICSICFNISDTNPCLICEDKKRDRQSLCIVEEPLQVLAIEKSGFKGIYHVLHGVISPLNNVGPQDLRIKELLNRLKTEKISEIILATNLTMEGEATAMYLKKLLHPLDIKITRLASGLPVGGDLEYSDEVTLSRALEGRREY